MNAGVVVIRQNLYDEEEFVYDSRVGSINIFMFNNLKMHI